MNWKRMSYLLAVALAATIAFADDSLSAGFGASNAACGSGEPTANVRYDRDSDDIPAHFRLAVGPNGSCTGQGISVDAYVGKREYRGDHVFGLVAAGYDSRTVPFEYVRAIDADPFKHFHGERVETVQALIGLGYDCGDNCSVRLVYNVVETPLWDGGNMSPVSIAATYEWASVEFNAEANPDVQSLDVSWSDGGMEVSGSISWGMQDLDNSAPPTIGDYAQAGAPDPLYSVSFGWRL